MVRWRLSATTLRSPTIENNETPLEDWLSGVLNLHELNTTAPKTDFYTRIS